MPCRTCPTEVIEDDLCPIVDGVILKLSNSKRCQITLITSPVLPKIDSVSSILICMRNLNTRMRLKIRGRWNWIMVPSTSDNGAKRLAIVREGALRFGRMVQSTRDIGELIKPTGRAG